MPLLALSARARQDASMRSAWLGLLALGLGCFAYFGCSGGGDDPATGAGGDGASSTAAGTGGKCPDNGACADCFGCAHDGPCSASYLTALSDPDTGAFMQCYSESYCDGADDWLACVEACKAQHPAGHAALRIYWNCIECTYCPSCQEQGWTKYYGCL